MIKVTDSVKHVKIQKINKIKGIDHADLVATEEPLQIKLHCIQNKEWIEKNLTITMRTPGNDFELVLGFLFSESIINSLEDILQIRYCETVKEEEKGNVVIVKLSSNISINFNHLNRLFYTNSSCGICGKTAIESINNKLTNYTFSKTAKISKHFFWQLSITFAEHQTIFKHTGGIHASALFDFKGKLIFIKEDVGRHNALDKIIGTTIKEKLIPLQQYILFLSGRVSFELVQKAIKSGIFVIVAVGAPSSLAVELAKTNKITLIGFLKKDSYNIYSCPERIIK